MAYIRKVKTASGATAVQIVRKEYGRTVVVRHIGSSHNPGSLKLLIDLAKNELIPLGQKSLFPEASLSPPKITLLRSFSGLLYTAIANQYTQLGFDDLGSQIFKHLCIARIVEPVSKLDSIRVLADLGIDGLQDDAIYRCLKKVVSGDYRKLISDRCYTHAKAKGISLLLYDVTTLYFEIQKEDELESDNKGYRKPGMSKERRLEPQIIVGLLVDSRGFPLALHSFEGNTAETKTVIPVLDKFRSDHKQDFGSKNGINDNSSDPTPMTVVADAGMLSQANLDALTAAGYKYIVGSRMNKIPYDIEQYQASQDKDGNLKVLTDGQIITSKLTDRRVVYQYREKRAKLDRRNIDKQIKKAEAVANGKSPTKKMKFLSIKNKSAMINQKLIDKAKSLAGIKGYVTNLENTPDSDIIHHYHQLWNVEASFRMAKSDLRARPIFHHRRDSIEAHLTIVLASMAISRIIEYNTKISIKKFVQTIKPLRSGIVSIGGKQYPTDPEIPPEAQDILDRLRLGH
jgi:transposase